MSTPQARESPQPRRIKKDTGFPEPFNGDRNTTLPHPDADTSQNATIEAQDYRLTRAPSRGSSFHLFGNKRKDSQESYREAITYEDNNDSSDRASTNSSRRDSSPSEVKSKKGFLSVLSSGR